MDRRIDEVADVLDAAARKATAVPQLSGRGLELTLEEAYRAQAALIERRLARGERRVGMKLGFTSRAKMRQMGVDDLIWGRLTDGMAAPDGAELDPARYVHPRVEPEVAFLLGRDLAADASPAEALAALDGVAPALEVIDSRYADFRFSLADVVADNASSSTFVVGPWSPPGTDVANRGLVMTFDGRAVQVGTTAAILGHPLRSLSAAARLAAAAGEPLRAGSVVMAGGATAAEALRPGVRVRVDIAGLGAAGFTVGADDEQEDE